MKGGMTTMSHIYKITNIINNMIYIGYTSRDINRRFYEHKWEAFNSTWEENKSYLYSAMREYGTENFVIESLLEFNEEEYNWKELEKQYIKDFESLVPNGYNILEGGDKPPIHYGNDNIKTKIKDEELPLLFEMLKDNSIPFKEVANKFNISLSQLGRINQGHARIQKDIIYPIRKYSQQEEYALQVMQILSSDKTLSNTKIASLIPNYFRANEIASINNGKKYAYLWSGEFPIRKELVPDNYEEKQDIALKVLKYIKEKNYKVMKKDIMKDTQCSKLILDKILKGIYPYSFSNIQYPIKLK